jgi:hypothetical protein
MRLHGFSSGSTESLHASNLDSQFYVNLPEVKLPELNIPNIKLPDLKLPDIPNIAVPEFPSIPSMTNFNLPSLDAKSFSEMDSNVLIPALGLVVFVILTASATGGASGTAESTVKRKKKNVLDIPYHAAARLAYDAWLDAHPNETYDEAAYQSFQILYESKAAAEAKSKKLARDLDRFSNKPLPEPVARTVTKRESPVESKSGKFFFAS